MSMEINSKYEKYSGLDVAPSQTTVSVTFKENGFVGNMIVDVDGVHLNTDNAQLVELVKDKIYSVLFPSRAENEKFAQVNETLKKSNETIDVTRKAFGEVTVQVAGLEDKLYRLAEHIGFSLDDNSDE